jgi:hypothetical protein
VNKLPVNLIHLAGKNEKFCWRPEKRLIIPFRSKYNIGMENSFQQVTRLSGVRVSSGIVLLSVAADLLGWGWWG